MKTLEEKVDDLAVEVAAIKGWLKGTVGAVGLMMAWVLAKGCA